MAQEYTRALLKVAVVQICHGIGWDSMQSTAGEVLVDIFHRYLSQFSKQIHMSSELTGRTEATVNDVALASRNMGIKFPELLEYLRFVESIPFPQVLPIYPVYKESHLNFLKPGSHEVLRRPVHVHEHLPAMYPEMEHKDGNNISREATRVAPAVQTPKSGSIKCQGGTHCTGNQNKRHLELEDEGLPLREISSVMMTTSGFLSTSREGKPPESRPTDFDSACPLPDALPRVKAKKVKSKVKESIKTLNKKDKENKEGSELKETKIQRDDSKVLKNVVVLKKKSKSNRSPKGEASRVAPRTSAKKRKRVKPKCEGLPLEDVAADLLSRYTATDKTSVGNKVEKILCEPDKQKLNCFKRISKVKDDKSKESPVPHCSREDAPSSSNADEESDECREIMRVAKIEATIECVIRHGMQSLSVPVECGAIHKGKMTGSPQSPKNSKLSSPKRKRRKVESSGGDILLGNFGAMREVSQPIESPENKTVVPISGDAHGSLASLFANPLIPKFHPSPHKEIRLPYFVHDAQRPAMPNLPLPPPLFTLAKADSEVEKNETEETKVVKRDRKTKKLKRKKKKNTVKVKKIEKQGNLKGKKIGQKNEQRQPVVSILKLPELSSTFPTAAIIKGVGRCKKKTKRTDTTVNVKVFGSNESLVENVVSITPTLSPSKDISKPLQNTSVGKKPKRSVARRKRPVDAPEAIGNANKEPLKSDKEETEAAYCFEEGGTKVWICPKCKGRDDGSLMIECDCCKAWYHCTCVGIRVPPEDSEDWFCKSCESKLQNKVKASRRKKRKR